MSCQKFLEDLPGPGGDFYDCAARSSESRPSALVEAKLSANSDHSESILVCTSVDAGDGSALAGPAKQYFVEPHFVQQLVPGAVKVIGTDVAG